MQLSGIADEAGADLASQIAAHRELGWGCIDLRDVDGVNFTDVDDRVFEEGAAALAGAGLRVTCFASRLANRGLDEELDVDVALLRRALPRMRRLGCDRIRCMSYRNDGREDPAWRDEAIRRLSELARIAAAEGAILSHENCTGWGGRSPEACLELLDGVGGEGFELCFDTGNPIRSADGDDAWRFYEGLRGHIAYVHVKDKRPDGEGLAHCPPGDGVGRIDAILADLFASGYDGIVAIEPHMTGLAAKRDPSITPERIRADYVAYGRRLEDLIARARQGAGS